MKVLTFWMSLEASDLMKVVLAHAGSKLKKIKYKYNKIPTEDGSMRKGLTIKLCTCRLTETCIDWLKTS